MPRTSKPRYFKPRNCYRLRCGSRVYYGSEAELWVKLDELKRRSDADVLTVADAIDRFLDRNPARTYALAPFLAHCGNLLLHEVTTKHLQRMMNALLDRKLKAWTVRQYVSAAHSLLRWSQKNEFLKDLPAKPDLPPAHANPAPIDLDLLQRIFAAIQNDHAEAVLRFRIETGCRPGEACNLRWAWFQPDIGADVGARGTFRIPPDSHKTGAKTGVDRVIYLSPAARKLIDDQPREGEFVFRSATGQPYTVAGVRSAWRQALARVAPDLKLSSYRLRHMFGFQMRRQGVAVDVLQKLFGHTSIKTTQVYYRAEDSAALAAVGHVVSLAPAPTVPSAPPPSEAKPPKRARKTPASSPDQSATPTSGPAGPSASTAV